MKHSNSTIVLRGEEHIISHIEVLGSWCHWEDSRVHIMNLYRVSFTDTTESIDLPFNAIKQMVNSGWVLDFINLNNVTPEP